MVQALFEGEVIKKESLDEMFQFIEFREVANMSAYGLGLQRFPRHFVQGKMAVGHGGGNIGTTTYMLYLPDYKVSVVVMINAFPNKAAESITKGLVKATLKDIDAIGLIPYIRFIPEGMIIIGFFLVVSFNVGRLIKKKRHSQIS
jgi:CubicO group peptidase (beta-lactamase class C family)